MFTISLKDLCSILKSDFILEFIQDKRWNKMKLRFIKGDSVLAAISNRINGISLNFQYSVTGSYWQNQNLSMWSLSWEKAVNYSYTSWNYFWCTVTLFSGIICYIFLLQVLGCKQNPDDNKVFVVVAASDSVSWLIQGTCSQSSPGSFCWPSLKSAQWLYWDLWHSMLNNHLIDGLCKPLASGIMHLPC